MMRVGGRAVTIAFLIAGLLSWVGWTLATRRGELVPPPSWLAVVVVVVMAGCVLWFGWPVRRYLAGRATTPLDPLRAARTVVLAQAAALTGAAAGGWYAGQLAVVARGFDLVLYQRRAVLLVGMLLLCLAFAGVGLLVQRWCHVEPPDDDGDPPAVTPAH